MYSEELLPLGDAGVRLAGLGVGCGASDDVLASDRGFFQARARALASLGVSAVPSNVLFEPCTAPQLGVSNAKLTIE